MCSFDLGREDDGELRKGGQDARSCEMKSYPCFYQLLSDDSFYDPETCTMQGCAHDEKCSKCKQRGHHVRTLVINDDLYVWSKSRRLPFRKRTAPELSGADSLRAAVDDLCVKEWLKAYHDKCWSDWGERQRMDSNTDLLRDNLYQTGFSTTGAADVMRSSGIQAATNSVDNRAFFDRTAAALMDPAMSAVGAAMAAATGSTASSRAAHVRFAGAIGAGGGEARSAAVATAVAEASTALKATGGGGEGLRALPSLGGSTASRTALGRGGVRAGIAARGAARAAFLSSLITASSRAGSEGGVSPVAARMVSKEKEVMQTAALVAESAVRRMTAPGVAVNSVVGGVGDGGCGGGYGDGGTLAAAVGVRPASPLDYLVWRSDQRAKFDNAGIFSHPTVNQWTPVQLARAVFVRAIGPTNAQFFPGMEEALVYAAKDHVPTGMTLTCGVVSPVEVSEQLCYKLTQTPNINVLLIIAKSVQNLVIECSVAEVVVTPPGTEMQPDGGGSGDAAASEAPSRKRGRTTAAIDVDEGDEEAPMSVGSGSRGEFM